LTLEVQSFIDAQLEQTVVKGEIKLPEEELDFSSIKKQCYQKKCYQKKWVVYCEKPFSSANNLIRYLGNYTHRVAISMAICNMKLKLQSCIDLIDKVAFLPVLEGLTSMEVWQSITPIAA